MNPLVIVSNGGQGKCFLCGASCGGKRRIPVNLRAVCRYLNVEASDVLINCKSSGGGGAGAPSPPPPDFYVGVCGKCDVETRRWIMSIEEQELIRMRVREGLDTFRRKLAQQPPEGEEGGLRKVLEGKSQKKMESLNRNRNPQVVVEVAPATAEEVVKIPLKKKRKCQHPPKWIPPHNPLKPWKCPHFECGQTFSSHSELLQHSRSPHPELSAKCLYCPETFDRRQCLDFHTVTQHLVQLFLECKSDNQTLEQFRGILFSVLKDQLKGAFQRSRKGSTTLHKCAHCYGDFCGPKKIYLMVHLVYNHRQLLVDKLNQVKNEGGIERAAVAAFQAEREEMETDDWVETYYDEIFGDLVTHEEYWRQRRT